MCIIDTNSKCVNDTKCFCNFFVTILGSLNANNGVELRLNREVCLNSIIDFKAFS